MRRLIPHFNSLLLGMIMGLVFVAIVHTSQTHQQSEVSAHGIAIGYEIIGAKDQTTVLLIAGTTTHLVRLPAGFCSYLRNQGCHASSFVTSASLVSPATHQQIRK
jgi:hypothetical protein